MELHVERHQVRRGPAGFLHIRPPRDVVEIDMFCFYFFNANWHVSSPGQPPHHQPDAVREGLKEAAHLTHYCAACFIPCEGSRSADRMRRKYAHDGKMARTDSRAAGLPAHLTQETNRVYLNRVFFFK